MDAVLKNHIEFKVFFSDLKTCHITDKHIPNYKMGTYNLKLDQSLSDRDRYICDLISNGSILNWNTFNDASCHESMIEHGCIFASHSWNLDINGKKFSRCYLTLKCIISLWNPENRTQ